MSAAEDFMPDMVALESIIDLWLTKLRQRRTEGTEPDHLGQMVEVAKMFDLPSPLALNVGALLLCFVSVTRRLIDAELLDISRLERHLRR